MNKVSVIHSKKKRLQLSPTVERKQIFLITVFTIIVCIICTSIYTVSQKKTRHLTLAHNFTKYWPIFKILSLLDSVGNL